jgi:hypothetical protein
VTARRAAPLLALAASILAAGCAPPGTPVQKIQAAKLGVATSSISAACGYAWELTGTGARNPKGLAAQDATATSAAHKLASVYGHSPSDIFEGESVGSILSDTVTLLDECGLTHAKHVLQQALAGHH